LRDRRQFRQKKHVSRARLIVSTVVIVVFVAGTLAGDTKTGERIADAAQRFLTFYSGVFALVALTGAVVAGLAATDRIVMSAGKRIVGQAVHRAMAFMAVAFLVTHIAMEVVVGKSKAIDSVVPFLAHGKTFYVGLGTIASDLIILIAATGIARRSFAEKSSPFVWRVLHGSAYLAWPLSIVHGLVAGRHPKPYVSWSYGACLLAVCLALVLRSAATVRPRQATAQAWPDDTGAPTPAAASVAAQAYVLHTQRAAAMAGISPGVPAGLSAAAARQAAPWPGVAASQWQSTPVRGIPVSPGTPVLPGTVTNTPAGGMPAAPATQYHTPSGAMPVAPGAVTHTPAGGMPAVPGTSHYTPAGGMPAAGTHTPAGGMPVAPGTVAHTPVSGMQAASGMQRHASTGGMPVQPGLPYHPPAGRMPPRPGPPYLAPVGGPAEIGAVPGAQYRAPAEWVTAAAEMDPPAEYEAVHYQVQALYPVPPDDQAGWAPR